MGKEWYWRSSKRSSRVLVENNHNSATAGCMCAVFQLFDFQHFQSDSANNHHTKKPPLKSITNSFELPEEPSIPKGAEAPRNSLEEEITSLSSIIEDEDVENFNNIRMGINQIKTSCVNKTSISETIDSPGTKTPSLVARLMGLDLLPENNSPSNSNSPNTHNNSRNTVIQNKAKHLLDHKKNSNSSSSGTRSLPETPRVSLARRSDVDIHHHRLSLQISKENNNSFDDLDLSRLSSLRKHKNNHHHKQEQYCYDSSTSSSGNSARSPGYYARQIVKQVKETVTTRKSTALADVTNTLFREHEKPKTKPSSAIVSASSSSFSCSPRLKVKPCEDQKFEVSKPTLLSSSLVSFPSPVRQDKGRRNKSGGETRRTMAKRIMEEETFVFGRPTKKTEQSKSYKRANINIPDKVKSKMTKPAFSSKSNNLLNINVVPTLLAVKKTTTNGTIIFHDHHLKPQKPQPGADDAQESKRIKVPTSSRSPSHMSVSRDTSSRSRSHVSVSRETSPSPKNDAVAIREYITKILGRTGLSSASHVSLSNWFSPSHPLDPSVFHRLELHFSDSNIFRGNSRRSHHGTLIISPRCNRKLTFDVVDELLAEILRPYMNLKPWTSLANSPRGSMAMQGHDLIEMLCSRVELFPCKDCHVLDDIDMLIDRDLSERNAIIIKSGNGNNNGAFEDEGEALVTEIERDLVDTLVHETALILIANSTF